MSSVFYKFTNGNGFDAENKCFAWMKAWIQLKTLVIEFLTNRIVMMFLYINQANTRSQITDPKQEALLCSSYCYII